MLLEKYTVMEDGEPLVKPGEKLPYISIKPYSLTGAGIHIVNSTEKVLLKINNTPRVFKVHQKYFLSYF